MEIFIPTSKQLEAYYSKIVIDYLAGAEALQPFYEQPATEEGYKTTLQNKAFGSEARQVLIKALNNQYKNIIENDAASAAVSKNIQLLAAQNTYTVTTGQQIHIYLGPLYVTYKILTTVAKTRRLQQLFPQYNFVPVFWMATEDHDFDEVNHLSLYNNTFTWQGESEYKGAVGKLPPQSINTLSTEIEALITNDDAAKQLLQYCTEAYTQSATFADATRKIVHRLYGHLGVVVIDADDATLKQQFIAQIKNDVLNNANHTAGLASTEALEKNYKAQINIRPINFFYLTKNGRHKIVNNEGIYNVADTHLVFSKEQMEQEIENNPQNFSPNVALRPLYQEVILPNIAYIGGPAEVNYWLQLKSIFTINNIPFPIIELRKSLIELNAKTADTIKTLGFSPNDFFNSITELHTTYLQKNNQGSVELGNHYQVIEDELALIRQKAITADGSLKPFLEGEFKKFGEIFAKLNAKLQKIQKAKHEVSLQKIDTIKAKKFTPGLLQERSETLLSAPFLVAKENMDNLLIIFNQQKSPLIIILPPLK